MERSKKRVAHLGQHVSKKKCSTVDDFVTNIMKAMDANITDKGNRESYDIINTKTREEGPSNLDIPSMNSKHIRELKPSVTLTQKKFLSVKRHPLMEKVQKNISYIKHNRRMPKPRAHLGGLNDSVQGKKVEIHSTQNSYSPEKKSKKSSFISNKNKPNKSDCLTNNTFSDECASDSEFESFIQAQKQNTDQDVQKSSKGEKNIKSKKDRQNKRKRHTKKKNCTEAKKPKSLETSDDEVLPKRSKKCKNSKIFSKVTNTNRLTLPETSNSSVASSDENECDTLFKTRDTSLIPSAEKENDKVSKQMDTNDVRCTVRIERNPLLEEAVCQLNSSVPKGDNQNNECYSKLLEEEKEVVDKFKDEVVLDSDDECMIVCEVPKTDDTGVNEMGDNVSDIQILNVVSLKESKKDTKCGDTVSKISNSSCDENSNINYEKLKEAIEIACAMKNYTNISPKEEILTRENSSNYKPNTVTDKLQTISDHDLKKETRSVPPDIIETMNKIDFKQILSLANSKSESPAYVVKEFNTSPCSSSFTEESPSFSKLTLNVPEDIPENHWQNLKKIVSMNHLLNEHHTTELSNIHLRNSDFVKHENNTNVTDNLSTSSGPSTSTINSSLNSLELKKILSNAERFTERGNTYQNKSFDKYQINNDYKDPCDEFDVLTTEAIQNICPNPSNQALLNLIKMLTRTYQEYIEIKKNGKEVTVGVKVLQKLAEDKKRQIEIVLENILKYDPCWYSTILEHKGTIVNSQENIKNSENEGCACSDQTKKCVNCGLTATIDCGRCKMVYFCSETCGIHYWETKHYKECTGL